MGQWMMLVLSRRYSTLPALTLVDGLGRHPGVTVPALGEGIRPLGPRTLPRRPTTPIMSGVATTTSKSNQFSFWIFSTRSISPTIVGAGRTGRRRPCRPWRRPARGRSCRCRWAGRWRRGPAGQRGGSRRPASRAAQRSRRTWRRRSCTISSMALLGVIRTERLVDLLGAVLIFLTSKHFLTPSLFVRRQRPWSGQYRRSCS